MLLCIRDWLQHSLLYVLLQFDDVYILPDQIQVCSSLKKVLCLAVTLLYCNVL